MLIIQVYATVTFYVLTVSIMGIIQQNYFFSHTIRDADAEAKTSSVSVITTGNV